MRNLLIIPVVVFLVMAVSSSAALYNVVDNQAKHGAPGSLNLVQTTGLVVYIDNANYRIYSVGFKLTNNSTTTTYNDVKVVDPYEWLSMSSLSPTYQATGWVDAQYQFIDPEYNGNDGVANGLYVRTYNGPDDPLESAMLMSNTNIPLTSPWGPGDGYETVSVLATDHVASWSVAASLAPGQSVSYKVYFDIERRSTAPTVGGKYSDMYVVAIPEPATIGLLGLGALSLLKRRRA
jgi:hypothetical protein